MSSTAEKIDAPTAEAHAWREPSTLVELFRRAAAEFDLPDALNYRDDDEWRPISSRDLLTRAENLALGLADLGIQRGDRAAILAPNSPSWTLADAACQLSGVVDVPIYTTLAPASVAYILNDSSTRLLFVDSVSTYDRIRSEVDACAALERVVVFSDEAITEAGERFISLAAVEARGQARRSIDEHQAETLGDDVGHEDVATLIYTSGTTGEPKGVMLTHDNLLSNVRDCSRDFSFSERDTCLSVLPLSHVFERTGMYVYIRHGMRVHYAESIERVPDNLKEVRPTIFIGVPRIFEKVFEKARLAALNAGRMNSIIFDWAIEVAKDHARCIAAGEPPSVALEAKHRFADKLVYSKFRAFFGGRLRHCITGGAALPDEIYLIFTGAGVSIMQGYGLTETSPVISTNTPTASKVGTVGRPIRNVSVRIADDGEIEVEGPGVMKGYYQNAQATTEAFTDDGWFRTGDIGHLDADGYLVITDRKKELFKTSGGKYIAPSPIEQMLRSSRFVSQAVLIGDGRKYASALIVPNFDMLRSYAELKGIESAGIDGLCANERVLDLFRRQIDAATEGLAQFETVKRFRLLPAELTVERGELTPTLKLKRRVIDERYRGVIESMYSDQ